MALDVIGTGFGRTGTKSLQVALEKLGYAPCHHMTAMFDRPEEVPYWQVALNGGTPDWDRALSRYRALADWPGVFWWRDLVRRYPDAKVVHTERPARDWYESFERTLREITEVREKLPPGTPMREMLEIAHQIVEGETFGGRADDRAHVMNVYAQHNDAIRGEVDNRRLLIYHVDEGWEPLCRFLDVEAPDEPFPRVTANAQFRQAAGLDEAG